MIEMRLPNLFFMVHLLGDMMRKVGEGSGGYTWLFLERHVSGRWGWGRSWFHFRGTYTPSFWCSPLRRGRSLLFSFLLLRYTSVLHETLGLAGMFYEVMEPHWGTG